jgi:hypothetical protein
MSDHDRDRGRLVNWGELLATCAASALATLVLSRLGVAGTILGAAVAPLIITLTTTALSNEAGRAREAAGELAGKDGRRPSLDPGRRRRLTAALATAAAATGILVAGMALAEAVTDGGSGSRSVDRPPAHESPTPTDGSRRTAHPSPTPTATVPTPTATPAEPTAPTPTPTAPSASPTAAPSPAAQP